MYHLTDGSSKQLRVQAGVDSHIAKHMPIPEVSQMTILTNTSQVSLKYVMQKIQWCVIGGNKTETLSFLFKG